MPNPAVDAISLILRNDPRYPPLLREIPRPPQGIHVRGSLSAISVPIVPAVPSPRTTAAAIAIAIVGTRRASPEGKTIAHRFARELAAAGCTIVSGLAFGIDAAAHEGCLAAGGKTIAVLAGGLDGVYPRNHARLAERILATGGGLVSEYPPGAAPYPSRFIERNRIISGLARGTLIVEAPPHSGALTTARQAALANRDVFAVPGSIAHDHFAGSHALIRQGATLVTAAHDILEEYGLAVRGNADTIPADATPQEVLVLRALRAHPAPQDAERIAAATGLGTRDAARAIGFLLAKDLIKEAGVGYTI